MADKVRKRGGAKPGAGRPRLEEGEMVRLSFDVRKEESLALQAQSAVLGLSCRRLLTAIVRAYLNKGGQVEEKVLEVKAAKSSTDGFSFGCRERSSE